MTDTEHATTAPAGRPWWWDKAKLLAALAEHGSCQAASAAAGGTPAAPTLHYWCRKHGIELTRAPGGRSFNPGAGVEDGPPEAGPEKRLDGLTDEEVTRLVEALGLDRAGELVGARQVGWMTSYLRRRGIAPGEKARSPRVAALERRVRELERAASGVEDLAAAIRDAATGVTVTPPPPPTVPRRRGGPITDTPVDIVAHVSDKQYGERVDAHEVPGGRYSPDVYRDERLPAWVAQMEHLIDATAAAHPLGVLWIAQGGDYVEGDGVFAGQEWHLAMDAGTQVATLAPVWAAAVAQVARRARAHGAKVAVVSVVGNHGVHGGRRAGAVPPSLSYDWLVYEMTRHILAGLPDAGGVDLYLEEAARAVYFTAQGHTFLMTHGDQDRGGGLIGVAAVTGLRNDLMVRRQARVDHRYHLKGHYHRPTTITPGGYDRIFWNGAWLGANNLSVGRGGASYPEQAAYVVHPLWGASPRSLPLMPASGTEADVRVVDGPAAT